MSQDSSSINTPSSHFMILADGSGSMDVNYDGPPPKPIHELRAALNAFLSSDLQNDPALDRIVKFGEVAIGLFRQYGSPEPIEWLQLTDSKPDQFPFHRLDQKLEVGPVVGQGLTPLADAGQQAFDVMMKRMRDTNRRTRLHRPVIFLITDGKPSEDQDVAAFSNRVRHDAYGDGDGARAVLHFLAFGTADADMETLRSIAPVSNWSLKGETLHQVMKRVVISLNASLGGRSPITGGSAPPPVAKSFPNGYWSHGIFWDGLRQPYGAERE